MNAIEQMLTGQMDMSDFVKHLNADESLREKIRKFVPVEAKNHSDHAFWSIISHHVLQEYDFDYLKFLMRIARFDGTLGDNYNIFFTINAAYCYYAPQLNYTAYYKDAFQLYLDAVGEYYEGTEIANVIEKIVSDALPITPKSKRIKVVRSKLKETFHIDGTKRPYWIQGGEWPMGRNSPMQYIGKSKIPDGVQYAFRDVDTGELRTIEQFY